MNAILRIVDDVVDTMVCRVYSVQCESIWPAIKEAEVEHTNAQYWAVVLVRKLF